MVVGWRSITHSSLHSDQGSEVPEMTPRAGLQQHILRHSDGPPSIEF